MAESAAPQQQLCDELDQALRRVRSIDPQAVAMILERFRYTTTQRHECKTAEPLLRLFVTELQQLDARLGVDAETVQAVEDAAAELLSEGHWRQGWCETARRGKPRWCVLGGPHSAPYLAHCADPDATAGSGGGWSWVRGLGRASLSTADDYGRLTINLSCPPPDAAEVTLAPREDAGGWLRDLQRACVRSQPTSHLPTSHRSSVTACL